jgi:UDP-N-acetyl-D-mannosaminuronic acid transferase (WecB/TagA/CpsF family)
VARGTPLQEIRSMHHAQQIKNYKLLVIHVWWLFDFLAWEEKRAPRFMRMLKAERIRRFFSSPSKNGKKVLNSFSVFWFVFKKLILNRPLF